MRKIHIGVVALGCGAALAGCADLRRAVTLPPVNAESPVAAQVRAAAPRSYVPPRLADVPPIPRNVPDAGAVKTGVIAMVRCRRSVSSYAPNHPPLSRGTAQFAANERDLAQVDPADIPPPDSAARSEASAAELRAYAAPPAALASGPAPTPSEAQPGGAPARPAPAPARRARAGRPAAAPPAPTAAPQAAPAARARAPLSPDGALVGPSAAAQPASPLPPPLPDPLLARCS